MGKFLLAILGIAFLSVLSNAQDIGRMRRLMLLRQRELALRRAFPFGPAGIGGPGIPPPVAARLALIQRQRALSNPFIRAQLGPLGSPFSPFSSRDVFSLRGPFTPSFAFPGPTDISRFDLSTLGISGPTFPDTSGMTMVGPNGLTPVGPVGPGGPTMPQGGSGNIFGQQPSQAAEFLETNRGIVEARPGFRPQEDAPRPPRAEAQRMQGPPDGTGERRRPPQSDSSQERFRPRQPPPFRQSPPFSPPVLPPPADMMFPLPPPQRQPPIIALEPRLPPLPPRRRGRPRPSTRRPRRPVRERRPRGPRVFPNVPQVVQIPAVAPGTQGQTPDGQLTQAGAGQTSGQPGQPDGTMVSQQGGSMFGQQGGGQQSGGMLTQQDASTFGQQGGAAMFGQQGGPMGGQPGGPMFGQQGGAMFGQQGGSMIGQPGGPMSGGPMPGPFGRPVGGPFGGPMRGPFPGQMTGPQFSFAQPTTSGQFSTGIQSGGVQGSAIFPSQATQGPILRQPRPGFTTDSTFSTGLDFTSSTTAVPGFPNGPALQFGDSVPGFGPSSQFMFPTGGLTPDALTGGSFSSTGFPGFPGGSFGPSFDLSPSGGSQSTGSGPTFTTSGITSFPGASFGPGVDTGAPGSGSSIATMQSTGNVQGQLEPNFGFVRPSNTGAAGPAFNTGAGSSTQNFNIQFQPLRPTPQVPQIPEVRPNSNQMGINTGVPEVQTNTGANTGFSFQGGMDRTNMQGNVVQGGMSFDGTGQTFTAGQNSQFTNTGTTTVVETRPNQQAGGMTFVNSGAQNVDPATSAVSGGAAQSGTSGTNTEFRVVEVGNIMGDSGFINTGTTGESVATVDSGMTQGTGFQPVGDINAAFQSFGPVEGGSENIVDLSLQPEVGTGSGNTAGQSGSTQVTMTKTVTTGGDSGSMTVTNTSSSNSVISFKDGPFTPNVNQDFSFFMGENNQAPNEMPPITFNAPEPPSFTQDGTTLLTFPVEGTGGPVVPEPSMTSQSGTAGNTVITDTSTGSAQPDTSVVDGAANSAVGGFV